MSVTDLPRLDPDSASLAELGAARERSWVAISDRGFEVLRYAEGSALLRDRRFQKGGSFRWRLDRLGIDDGPVRASWNRMLVTNEGDERTHLRLPLSRLLGVRRTGGLGETTREIVSGVLEEAPVTGEIDFMETIGTDITTNHGSLHMPKSYGPTGTVTLPNGASFADAFHTFAV